MAKQRATAAGNLAAAGAHFVLKGNFLVMESLSRTRIDRFAESRGEPLGGRLSVSILDNKVCILAIAIHPAACQGKAFIDVITTGWAFTLSWQKKVISQLAP